MNTRRLVLMLAAVSLALTMVFLWCWQKKAEARLLIVAETNAGPTAMQRRTVEALEPKTGSSSVTNLPAGQFTAGSHNQVLPSPTGKEKQMREWLSLLNDEQVVLYGRVVDQFESAVVGASVSGTIQVNNGARVGTDVVSLTTDGNGLFTVSGYKGKAMGVSIRKPGYVMATANTRFVNSLLWPKAERYVPD